MLVDQIFGICGKCLKNVFFFRIGLISVFFSKSAQDKVGKLIPFSDLTDS